jgi:hypothetical protein
MARLLADPAAASAAGRRGAETVARRFSPARFEAAGEAVVRRVRETVLACRS